MNINSMSMHHFICTCIHSETRLVCELRLMQVVIHVPDVTIYESGSTVPTFNINDKFIHLLAFMFVHSLKTILIGMLWPVHFAMAVSGDLSECQI